MVDIKTLRIGSHVLVEGKRVKVCGVTRRKVGYHHSEDRPNANLRYARANEVEPISIIEELLKELGFANTSSSRRITYTKGIEYEDLWIEVRNLKDRWEVFVSDNNWDGRIVCRYLHELETFVYLATGKELIED